MNIDDKDKIVDVNLVGEMKTSFLDYSMSVIVARAIPDVRDGLKPVHRRILYTLYEEGMTPDKKHQKSANAVGAVMGHYHPHGDAAIYDTMVRMAQTFTYRHVLVDGHGNFGNIDGDGAAASRYTEARLSKISMEILRDLNKDTVDFMENYDGQRKEPVVLPSRFPNILVNGNMGIAVGMATNIPPHNLGEVIDAFNEYIDNPNVTVMDLMKYIKGPDFPTGGIILGNSGIKKAFESGKGVITIRSRIEIVEKNGKEEIIITELPYQVNKKDLITRIAELVRDKIIVGITNLNDESALGGVKIVIDVKKEANAKVVLNNLYKHTQLQASYGINFLMLVNGRPLTLGLLDIFKYYLDHQKEVITRRTRFDLNRAQKRAHILEGLKIALDNIDAVIKLIKSAKSDVEAKEGLINEFNLSIEQSDAILEMKLRRLTGLERDKIEGELSDLMKLISELEIVLSDPNKVLEIIKNESKEIKDKYADDRKTEIDMTAIDYIEDESLIPVENILITLTNKGYIKRLNVDTYRLQNRGGVGVKGITTNDEDYVERIVNASTHDYILFFSNYGKVYRIKGYEIPEFSRQSKGIPIVNLLPVEKNEYINSIVKISNEENDLLNLVFFTKNGLTKRTSINEFDSIRKNGKLAISLKDDDELIAVKKSNGNNEIIIASTNGRLVRFNENEIRTMGRNTSGVRGIDLAGGKVVGADVVEKDQLVLVLTEKGYGKKTIINEYRLTHRGSKGVKALNITEKNGNLVAVRIINGDEDLVLTTNNGIIIRLDASKISIIGRATQGVRLINLKDDQKLATVAIVNKTEDEDSEVTNENAKVE